MASSYGILSTWVEGRNLKLADFHSDEHISLFPGLASGKLW